ncbi:MAG TPA: glycosyl hydrolase family 18 protein [Hanamia sp.]|nr:glycosyl hydrolase family 18 protein [Hanamia sp.]
MDRIDVDLEAGYAFGNETDPNYEAFIIELTGSLISKNKLITSAIPDSREKVVTHKVLAQFYFINIMSYDHTGLWSPDRPGNHTSYAEAMDVELLSHLLKIPI